MAAMMMGGGGLPGGFHQDVLNASPTDSSGKKNLAEECKSRAKGSLASKNYPEAISLYTKAAEVMAEENDNAYVSILYANMSMCKLSMGKAEEAASDADKAIELDSSYVKAYYRAGAAYQKLKKWEEAKNALLKGLEKKPEDKEMRTMMDTIQAAIVSGEPSSSNTSSSALKSTSTTTKTTAKPSVKATSKSSTASSSSSSSSSTLVDDDEEVKGEQFRGYKKTSDGRTTSYFNNELDEATKELIGDITPQAISNTSTLNDSKSAPGGSAAPSAWNSAGTFESKDKTAWAKSRLSESIKHMSFSLAGVDISVEDVKDMVGDAEIIMNRGKKKAIYEFSCAVDFEASLDNETIEGTLQVTDISGDDDPECSFTLKSKPSTAGAKMKVNDAMKGFIKALNLTCSNFKNAILEQ